MQALRDVVRVSLAKSLQGLTPLDRLAASWPVVAGHAVASRTSVTGYENHIATVTVPDKAWADQLWAVRERLRGDLSSVSRLPVTDILFLSPPDQRRPE